MPPKGSSKHPRYLGTDGRGYGMFQCITEGCQRVVWGRSAERCRICDRRFRAKPNYVGIVNGRQMYRAQCGHLAFASASKRCRSCVRSQATNYPVWQRRSTGLKQQRVHRMIAEQALGRKLKPGEVVHHVNMDKTDNRRCNLLICTREYHRFLHVQMERATAARIRAWQDAQGV